jgi:DNA-directed RNA polymerase specialized sigma24 family protein
MNDSAASVSTWLEQLKGGDEEAARLLWERYFRRLLGLARARLVALRRQGAADEEDVALSAFHDFCRAARAERYADLRDRESLWRVLATFVINKAKALVDRERAGKRGADRVQGESGLGPAGGGQSDGEAGFQGVPSPEPGPDLQAEMKERFESFLAGLSEQEAEIACLRMHGHSTEEIAGRVSLAPATVRRRLAVIRDALEEQFSNVRGG